MILLGSFFWRHVTITGTVLITILSLFAAVTQATNPSRPGTNYEEDKIPPYTLPDPLVMFDGTPVMSLADWQEHRRPEILRRFETDVYGRRPDPISTMKFEVIESNANALNGAATRKQISILFNGEPDGPRMDLLVYLPNQGAAPAPVFLGINFDGNQTVHADPSIAICRSWVRRSSQSKNKRNHATEESRGSLADAWSIDKMIEHGYGVATFCCGDIAPDHSDGFKNGVQPLFYKEAQVKPAPDEWGTIAVWSWGLSRALDYLETDHNVDAKRVAVFGHSRMGKAALWAGAEDPRFALVISNNSGCMGAALSRRAFGETPEQINKSFPHWMCGAFKKYDGRQAELPLDQHLLIALIAPRPVYVASAADDLWADPKGEFLAAQAASPVYELFGVTGLVASEWPKPDEGTASGLIGYHLRPGDHALTPYDWDRFLKFSDLHLK